MNSTRNLRRNMSVFFAVTIMLLSIFSGVLAGTGYGVESETWVEISNEAGLAAINNNLSANYKLLSDINISSNWTPLGTFSGKFDGNGKVIRNLTISNTTIGNAGLFTIIGAGAQVRNFGIEGANITAGNNAGILTGTNNGEISMVYVSGSVSGQDNVGGLVGYNTTTINNSFASASVSGKDKIGGLVGLNSGSINQSYSTSQVIDSVFNNYLVFDGTTGYISIPHHADYVTGTFTLEAWFQWDDVTKALGTDPNNYVDFIIGKGVERFEIHTEGGSGRNGVRFIPIGNVAGDSHLDVKNVLQPGWFHVAASYSYSEDNDKATASFFVNGVAQDIWQQGVNVGKVATMLRTSAPVISASEINIGRRTDGAYPFKGRIADVRFWNTVRTEEQIAANKDRKLTGTEPGLVGYWKLNEDLGVTAVDSVQVNGNPKNNGTLVGGITRTSQSAATNKGGLVGSNSGTVTTSYYDSTVSFQADVGKGTGKTTDEMKTQETFSGWDFINTWGINGSINGGYPYLKLETTYTVTFKDHDNTVLKTEVVSSGGSATPPANPTRTGYTFTGWSPEYNNITGNMTVTAQYSINQYTVTFKDHDDTTLKMETVNYGGNATPPANPVRTGYTFTGWDITYNNVTGNLTVNAQYSINQYTVTFKDHDDTTLKTETVNYDGNATPPANLTRIGYTFTGWDVSYNNVTGNLTAIAQYSINQYTVTFKDHDDTTLKAETVSYDGSATPPANPARAGYTFTGWDIPYNNVTGNLTVVAQYSINQYTVTFKDHDDTTLKTETVNYDGSATPPANPERTGYTFAGWDITYNNVTGNLTVNAQYSINQYTVTFKDHDTTLKTETVNYDGNATPPANPERTGYIFTGWDITYNNVTGNLTVNAQYSINQYTVTFKDHDDTTLKAETVSYDGSATPPANPARTGYTFTGWSPEYNNITSNLIITAQYTANSGIMFKVEHYKQRLNMTGYDLYETDNLTGSTGQSVIASPKSYTGFAENNSYPDRVIAGTVSADGSLILKIYYDIASYTIASIENQMLEDKTEGYSSGSQETKTITINKTGTKYLANLAVAISGGESSKFSITQPQVTVLDATTTSTTFTVKAKTGLTAGTYIETVTISGDNMTNVTFTVTQIINALSAPVIQTVVSGDDHVNISWSNVTDATDYKLYKSTTSGSYDSDFLSVSNSVYDVKGLSNGTTYYFVVKAVNGGCESVNSTEVSVTPQVAAPGAPEIKAAFSGDGHVILAWDGVSGSTGYKVYSSTTSGTYSGPVASVAGSVYNYDVTGLKNGTTYYFALKATNPGGTSPYSNEISAKPQVAAPTEPTGISAASGNAKVSLKWNSVAGATSYKVYQTTTSGSYGSEVSSVSGSVYNHDVTGLTNGLKYYFVIKAANSGGDSPNSMEVSAIPKTVPGVPINVTAEVGNGQATITFSSPAENGGSPVTGYIVASYPDNITASGNGTTITVTGLKNGTTYTFKVRAINEVGNGDESQASNEVKPYKPSSGGSSTTPPNTTTNTETTKTTEPTEPEKQVVTGLDVIVNGKTEILATATKTKVEDKTITTIVVDDKKVEEKLEKEGNNSIVTIPVKNNSDVVIGILNGQTIKNMEVKEAVLEVKTENVTYTLPASQISIDTVSQQIGKHVELKDIAVNVKISEPKKDTAKIVENTANKNNYQVVVKPIDFEITCTSGNKTVDISKFNSYVERVVAIPEGVNPTKITTGIVLNNDGTFSHVPTTIEVIEGKYYAKINSLTNSTYSVIWSPKIFKDVEGHWSKEAANDMGSRLIIDGIGDDRFEPEREITRAEFAAIVIRALGLLRTGTGKNVFNDVTKGTWYYDSVYIAHEYEIISGYGNDKFGPMDKTTREQAMTMIARAMKVSNLKVELNDDEENTVFSLFKDLDKSSAWAKDSIAVCIKSEIISGRGGAMIVPKDNITRAEATLIVRRLLTKSNLIN